MKKNYLIFIFLLFFPFFVFAIQENCYGNHGLATIERSSYKLTNGYCEYPTKINKEQENQQYYPYNKEHSYYPFIGLSSYKWSSYDINYQDNVSVENDLLNCGKKDSPCYCDNTIKLENPNYQKYCCPNSSNSLCKRSQNLIYVNRPFYSIYTKNGDLEIRKNLAISGDSNYFLKDYSKISVASNISSKLYNTYLLFRKNISDIWLNASAKIARNLIFRNKHSNIQLSEENQLSKVKKNKIILSNLTGKKQNPIWEEINAKKLNIESFGELNSITANEKYYYFTDRAEKKIHRISNSGETLSAGNHDWAWTPEGITLDEKENLYITSSFKEYDEESKKQLRIISPSPNTIYKVGEKIIISWAKLPKATRYKLHYRKNDSTMENFTLNQKENSFEMEATQDMIGAWTFTISVLSENNEVFANNTCTFNITSLSQDIFRILSPAYNAEFQLGDIIPFSWDSYPNASEYRLIYSTNGGIKKELSAGTLTIFEIESAQHTLPPGDYEFKINAYDANNNLLKESINNIIFNIKQEKKEQGLLSNNIFKISLEKNNNGNIKNFEFFMPKQNNFKATKEYELIKEYLTYRNNDPLALTFSNPKGIKYHNKHLYIVDNGNNRIIRLSNNIVLSSDIAEKLKKIKNIFLEKEEQNLNLQENWQDTVASSTYAEEIDDYLDDFWKIIYDKNTDNILKSLNDPKNIFVISSTTNYITDYGNNRIILQQKGKWSEIKANWKPYGIIKKGIFLYITDVANGNITRIDMGAYNNNNKKLLFNDTYFQLGRRGQEKFEFSFPVDIVYKNELFYILDSVSNTGYSLIAGNTDNTSSSSLVNLYSGEASRKIDIFFKNPYNNELNSDTFADKIKIDDSVSYFNNIYNRIRKWEKGPGVAHCQKNCSAGYAEKRTKDNCGNEYLFTHTCNGCWKNTIILDCDGTNKCDSGCTDESYDAKFVRTCRDQWDWDANSPSCIHYEINWNCRSVPDCCGKGCEPDVECCKSSHLECAPFCEAIIENCHVGYAVSFNYYTDPTKTTSVESKNNYNLSIKEGWPDYIYLDY